MKIYNMGSLNIDYVYRVPHFVQPGETIPSYGREIFAGGKGCSRRCTGNSWRYDWTRWRIFKGTIGRFWCGYHTYMYTTGSEWSYGDPGR